MTKEAIRDFSGWILGWIETDSNGDKTARDFTGNILGRYFKDRNVTTNFSGWVLGKGDFVVSLITENVAKNGDGRK